MNNKQIITTPTLPEYMKKVNTIYENKFLCRILDNDFILKMITFGCRKTLVQAVLREIEPSKNVLQIGATFGSQIDKVAQKVGYYGNYHLVDVSKTQTDRCKKKYKDINQNMNFSNQNGLAKINNKYDYSISFMLLHELPSKTRAAMVDNLLESVNDENGKVIFIDYNKPERICLISKILKIFNRLYRPFTEDFLDQEISKISKKSGEFNWNKCEIFGGFYQKVVATRKPKERN